MSFRLGEGIGNIWIIVVWEVIIMIVVLCESMCCLKMNWRCWDNFMILRRILVR